MFGFFRKKPGPTAPDTAPPESFPTVLLAADAIDPDPSRIAAAVAAAFPAAELTPRPAPSRGPEDGTLACLDFGDAQIGIRATPAPAPFDGIEAAFAVNRTWEARRDALRSCRAHILVFCVTEPKSFLDRFVFAAYVLFTASVVATMARTAAAFCPAALSLSTPNEVMESATLLATVKPPPPPMRVWVRPQVIDTGRREGGRPVAAALTTGLRPFVEREVELVSHRTPPTEMAGRAMAVAEYLLRHGPVLKDGETIGPDPSSGRIRLTESAAVPGLPVYRIA